MQATGIGKTENRIDVRLNNDLNILTGKNGSGKTTVLKLIWYLMSGNIEHALREIPFTEAILTTSDYELSIKRTGPSADIKIVSKGDELRWSSDDDDEAEFPYDPVTDANEYVKDIGASIFFPTFRRIEGGFSIRNRVTSPRFSPVNAFMQRTIRSQGALEDAMSDLSRRMTVERHVFVASISTADIVQLLMKQYTDMSERSNLLQQEASDQIIARIKDYKLGKTAPEAENAEQVLDGIKASIEKLDIDRETILLPLNAVRTLAQNLFQHEGIKLSTRLNFGDAANAVSSDSLSAGEKQMLSFICYNAFSRDSVIFIDEPELSLHVDWQRQLFSIMQKQGTNNQFIIATHSPFIYGKFPEKEILLNEDRGANTPL